MKPLAYLPDLVFALDHAAETGQPFHVIGGGGSNVVLAPHVPGIVGLNRMMGMRIDRGDSDAVRIIAAAGEDWPGLVDWILAEGIGGLENLAGIPGTLGVAPIPKIGAYGRELSDLIEHLTALDTRTRRPGRIFPRRVPVYLPPQPVQVRAGAFCRHPSHAATAGGMDARHDLRGPRRSRPRAGSGRGAQQGSGAAGR
ncbi:MAG: FAD-binding protein [Maritimibacter sp.]|uniref:FAD-binding protein n=1 Tax=Maritimibacter sp. TaxID=2003363 RepID=UPI001DE650BD|nr:FAD-binding protein [Maritimibacter sp.]MBL6430227.1 FAD-binding protein [Maritimibacter sp.]